MSDQETDGNAPITLFGSLKTQGNKHSRNRRKILPWPQSGAFQSPLDTPNQGQGASPPWSFRGIAPGRFADWPIMVLLIVLTVLIGVSIYLGFSTRQNLRENLVRAEDRIEKVAQRLDVNAQKIINLKSQVEETSEKMEARGKQSVSPRHPSAKDQMAIPVVTPQQKSPIVSRATTEEAAQHHGESAAGSILVTSRTTEPGQRVSGTAQEPSQEELRSLAVQNSRSLQELVELARRMEREYFEFNLDRKGAKQGIGSVLLELRKVNLNRNFYNLLLTYRHKKFLRRKMILNQPFYVYDPISGCSMEIVVNKFTEKGVSGYLSAPVGFLVEDQYGFPSRFCRASC